MEISSDTIFCPKTDRETSKKAGLLASRSFDALPSPDRPDIAWMRSGLLKMSSVKESSLVTAAGPRGIYTLFPILPGDAAFAPTGHLFDARNLSQPRARSSGAKDRSPHHLIAGDLPSDFNV